MYTFFIHCFTKNIFILISCKSHLGIIYLLVRILCKIFRKAQSYSTYIYVPSWPVCGFCRKHRLPGRHTNKRADKVERAPAKYTYEYAKTKKAFVLLNHIHIHMYSTYMLASWQTD